MTTNTDASSGPTRAIADFAFGGRTGVVDVSRPLAWLSPEEMEIDLADPVARRFGDYELIEKIGQGGMGVVYRARQHGLERDVAVKLLSAGPWASEEFIARFRREARSAARMQHPNIVEIHEFGHRDGLNYFSMRLIEGESLAQKLTREGPLPAKQAAALLRVLAEAMDYAHRLGVLHLDLKPANVLLTPDGVPLIADFGLARRIDAGHGDAMEISGTPSYMAPEQAQLQSHPLSASTDIYGLGAVLYEALAGRPPFQAADAQETLLRVVGEAPASPRSLRKGLSRDLDAICLRCLEKEPKDRYSSARELADDLGRFVEGHAVRAHPLNAAQRLGRWVRREPRLAGAVGIALLAFTSGVVATALQWQRAEAALASAEFFDLAMMLPGAENDQLQRLQEQIQTKLSEQRRRQIVEDLSASSDPHQWLVAGLVGESLAPPENAVGGVQIRRALEARPDDAFGLLVAITHCVEWNCPVPDAPARLVRLQPDNLFAWEALIDPRHLDVSGRGRRLWQMERDPAFKARIRALVAQAARATRWDDGLARMAQAKGKAFDADFVRLPSSWQSSAADRRWAIARGYERATWQFHYEASWLGGWRSFHPVLARLCMYGPATATDPALQADCRAIGRVLAERSTREYAFVRGLRMLHQLQPGSDEVRESARHYEWIKEQDTWRLDRRPLESGRAFLENWERHGEMEAMRLHLDRLGIARAPPPDWKPKHHDPLLLSEIDTR